jgi:16S rRNA (guanine527-N7)-methyltransferase
VSLREAVAAQLVWPLPTSEVPEGQKIVEELAARVHAVDPEIATSQLVGWLELVRQWNRKIDLTAAKNDDDLAELGVLDAVQIAGRIARDGGGVVDVGSGFGAPGIAVAILRPDLEVKLCEPLQKRATFLRNVIASLNLLDRVEVLETRGEDLADAGIRFDAAISRATLSPSAWLLLGDRLAPTGDVVVLLARDPDPVVEGRHVAWRIEYQTRDGAPRVAIGMRRKGTGHVDV